VYTRECGNKLGMTSQFMRLVVRPAADVDRLMDGIEDYARQWRGSTPFDAPSYATEPVDLGYARRWNVEEPPDNLIQYPTRRASGY
jgi:hypothetical protein